MLRCGVGGDGVQVWGRWRWCAGVGWVEMVCRCGVGGDGVL